MKKNLACILVIFLHFLFLHNFLLAGEHQYIPKQENQKKSYLEEQIAVLDFTGNVDNRIRKVFVEKLEGQLAILERFTIVNRLNIEKVLNELALSQTGLISEEQALKVGRMLAANKIVIGQINYCEVNWNGKSEFYEVQISVTGKLIEVEKAVISSGSGIDIIANASDKNREKAILDTIDKAVSKFLVEIRNIFPLEARIIKITGSNSVINMGKSLGIKPGMLFEVYRVGKTIIDPFSGELLGQEENRIGIIGIMQVQAKYADSKIIKGRYKINEGDKIVEAAKLKFPSFNLSYSYSSVPVNVKTNSTLQNKDITKAEYHSLSIFYETFYSSGGGVGGRFTGINMGAVSGIGFGMLLRKGITIIPEFLEMYVNGSLDYNLMTQNLLLCYKDTYC